MAWKTPITSRVLERFAAAVIHWISAALAVVLALKSVTNDDFSIRYDENFWFNLGGMIFAGLTQVFLDNIIANLTMTFFAVLCLPYIYAKGLDTEGSWFLTTLYFFVGALCTVIWIVILSVRWVMKMAARR